MAKVRIGNPARSPRDPDIFERVVSGIGGHVFRAFFFHFSRSEYTFCMPYKVIHDGRGDIFLLAFASLLIQLVLEQCTDQSFRGLGRLPKVRRL